MILSFITNHFITKMIYHKARFKTFFFRFAFYFFFDMVVHRNRPANKRTRVTIKQRRQWCAREKLLVIKHGEQCGSKHLTAKRFQIELKQVRDWINQKTKLENAAPYIQKLHKGKSPAFSELEKELSLWVIDLRKAAKAVT